MQDAQTDLNNRTYAALGRFIAEFSSVLHALEWGTVYLFGFGPDGKRIDLALAALADRTASPVVSAFFSVFHAKWGDTISDEDKKIIKAFRTEVTSLVETRNRLLHDAWMGKTVGGDPGPHPLSIHRLRAHGTGAEHVHRELTPEALNALADDASRLCDVAYSFVMYDRPGQVGPELHPRIVLSNGRVADSPARGGPTNF